MRIALVRSAGVALLMAKSTRYATIVAPVRFISFARMYGYIRSIIKRKAIKYCRGKAGITRKLGIRPTVRRS